MGNKIKYSWNILILLLFNIYREKEGKTKRCRRKKLREKIYKLGWRKLMTNIKWNVHSKMEKVIAVSRVGIVRKFGHV